MRRADSPEPDDSNDDVPWTPEQGGAAGLPERLLRLPAGHPSSADARPSWTDSGEEEMVSHPPWPEEWLSHDAGRPEPGGDAATGGDGQDEVAPEPDAGGAPAAGRCSEPASGWHSSADSDGLQPPAGRGPYRPWFTAGSAVEPWFAAGPDGLLGLPEEPDAS
jgi:hypothetical protein